MNREVIGLHELEAIVGESGLKTAATLAQISPTLSHALVDFGFGEIISQAELGRREREIATVAMLAAIGGAEPQLRSHVGAALRCGLDPEELITLIEHVVVYAGFPRTLNALTVVRSVLEEQQYALPAATKRVWLSDHETLVTDTGGDGIPLVFIHSLGLDRRVTRDMIPLLAPTRRVVVYDLRGHGAAQAAPHPITLERFADDLHALLDALTIEQADIAGLSLGGAIAQQFALTYPQSVRALALVQTSASAFPAMLERAEAAERDGMEAQIASTLIRWFTPQAIALNGWAIRYARERILRASVEDWAASWRALAKLNTFERLEEITQPVQVIAGELDQSTPPALMKEIADRLPHASFDVVAGGPHMLSLEKPGELAHLLLRNR